MRRVVTALCVLVTGIGVSAADWTTAIKPALSAVVRLEIQRGDKTGRCSGVVFNADAGYALTMAHCTGAEPKGLSLTANGRHADLIRWNEILDLAVIKFDVKGEAQIVLAKQTPPMGTEIALLGFAYGSRQLHTQYGRVSLPLDEESQSLMLDVTTLFGDSGGMAINAAGELVGMTSALKFAGGHLAVMVPVEATRDFVKAYLPKTP